MQNKSNTVETVERKPELRIQVRDKRGRRLFGSEARFELFRRWLRGATGDRCLRYGPGRVQVLKNEFSPARDFASVGEAIDNFRHAGCPDFQV